MNAYPVLIVASDLGTRESFRAALVTAGFVVFSAHSVEAALELLEKRQIRLIYGELQLMAADGYRLLREIREFNPDVATVLISRPEDSEQVKIMMRFGVHDYVMKPFEPAQIISLAFQHSAPETENIRVDIVAVDHATKELLAMAQKVAKFSTNVLLMGEAGVGKKLIAKFIHSASSRRAYPFVTFSCPSSSEDLLEKKLVQAQGGTLLLEAVSETPFDLQAKLSRVLQERVITKAGVVKPISLDVRVMATSTKELRAQVTRGKFREDLFYRLNVFPLWVPPLRARRKDVLHLAQLFLNRYRMDLGCPDLYFSDSSLAYLERHEWAGNAQELKSKIVQACAQAKGNTIYLGDAGIKRSEISTGSDWNQKIGLNVSNMKYVEIANRLPNLSDIEDARITVGVA